MLTSPIVVDSGSVTVPVSVGEANGALVARLDVIVDAKLASSLSASASSLRVLRADGAAPISVFICSSA